MIDLINIAKSAAEAEEARERELAVVREQEENKRVTQLCLRYFNVTIIDDMAETIQDVVTKEYKWFLNNGIKIEVRVNNCSATTSFRVNRTDTLCLEAGSNCVNVHLDCDKGNWLTLSSESKRTICRYVGENLAKNSDPRGTKIMEGFTSDRSFCLRKKKECPPRGGLLFFIA